MIRTILYEDNESLRNSLSSLLQWQSDIELVAAMPNAETVLVDIAQCRPDVVLMDIDMPVVNGIEALKKIRQQHADLPVIMLTVFEDNDNIFNAICAGASGYLLKKSFDQIIPALKDVLAGGAPMTGSIAKKVLTLFPRPAQTQIEEEKLLSSREQELLQLLIKGYSYKMIAEELNIALETVRSHIKKIYRKLQVNSATEAIYKITNTTTGR
ncbi:MAG: response regulator transcription factor [Niastella sp.]|nr:response regulator transcription factor [Niastella sp.]